MQAKKNMEQKMSMIGYMWRNLESHNDSGRIDFVKSIDFTQPLVRIAIYSCNIAFQTNFFGFALLLTFRAHSPNFIAKHTILQK
jgi:hypothetical protein